MDLNFVGAGIAIGLAALGVAVGQGFLIYKSMEVIGKNPKMSGFYLTTTILGIALVESAAIYGLIIAFQILSADFVNPLAAIGVGLSIGLSGLGVGIGEGLMLSGAIDAMNKDTENRNKIMTYMILFLALIESAAIYGMIVAFQLLGDLDISPYLSIGAGLAIGLAGLGAGVGEGIMAKKAIMLIGEKPKLTNFLLTITILGIALVESAAIYGLIIAFNSMEANVVDSMVAVGAGLAVGLAGLGVGIGEGLMVSGAMEAMSIGRVNKSKILTYMILFVALVESAAIYGLIISFQILSGDIAGLAAIGAGLSIGLAGLGVGIGEGILSKKSIIVIGKRPSLSMFFLTVTILGIALVESAAIYGLVVSFKILSSPEMLSLAALGAGLSIGFSALGAGIGEGVLVGGTFDAMSRNPANKSKDLTFMILFLALVEVLAIYGLIIAFKIIG